MIGSSFRVHYCAAKDHLSVLIVGIACSLYLISIIRFFTLPVTKFAYEDSLTSFYRVQFGDDFLLSGKGLRYFDFSSFKII